MRKSNGFTLIEMAVVLILIGLVMGITIAGSKAAIESHQRSSTKDKLDVIRVTLINHIARTRRLPCPASPNSTTGVEATWSAPAPLPALQLGTCAGLTPFGRTYAGILPWSTLGMSPDMVNDPWSHRITYVVSQVALVPDGYRRPGTITVHSTAPIILGAPPAGNQINVGNLAIVLLVSHGRNGYGAWGPGGAVMAAAPGALERENRPVNTAFVLAPTDDTNANNPFDDQLLWFSASDIAQQLSTQVGDGSAESITRARLSRLRDSFIGAIVSQTPAGAVAVFPTPANVPGLVSGPFVACNPPGASFARTPPNRANTVAVALPTLPTDLQTDGWGQSFIYTYRLNSASAFTKNTPPNTAVLCPAIQIRSQGANGQSGTVATETDDLVETILETDISARLP